MLTLLKNISKELIKYYTNLKMIEKEIYYKDKKQITEQGVQERFLFRGRDRSL